MGQELKITRPSSKGRIFVANLLVAIQFIALGILLLLALLNISASNHDYLIFEAISISIGTAVIFFAAYALKPALRVSPIPKENSPFIAVGIYRFLRHPMYLGVILIGFGLAGFANLTVGWIVELALIINLNFKAQFEDAMLREIHDDAWHYQRHTSGILPCVGRSCRNNCGIDGMAEPTK